MDSSIDLFLVYLSHFCLNPTKNKVPNFNKGERWFSVERKKSAFINKARLVSITMDLSTRQDPAWQARVCGSTVHQLAAQLTSRVDTAKG